MVNIFKNLHLYTYFEFIGGKIKSDLYLQGAKPKVIYITGVKAC